MTLSSSDSLFDTPSSSSSTASSVFFPTSPRSAAATGAGTGVVHSHGGFGSGTSNGDASSLFASNNSNSDLFGSESKTFIGTGLPSPTAPSQTPSPYAPANNSMATAALHHVATSSNNSPYMPLITHTAPVSTPHPPHAHAPLPPGPPSIPGIKLPPRPPAPPSSANHSPRLPSNPLPPPGRKPTGNEPVPAGMMRTPHGLVPATVPPAPSVESSPQVSPAKTVNHARATLSSSGVPMPGGIRQQPTVSSPLMSPQQQPAIFNATSPPHSTHAPSVTTLPGQPPMPGGIRPQSQSTAVQSQQAFSFPPPAEHSFVRNNNGFSPGPPPSSATTASNVFESAAPAHTQPPLSTASSSGGGGFPPLPGARHAPPAKAPPSTSGPPMPFGVSPRPTSTGSHTTAHAAYSSPTTAAFAVSGASASSSVRSQGRPVCAFASFGFGGRVLLFGPQKQPSAAIISPLDSNRCVLTIHFIC